MQEPTRDELVNELPKIPLPITATSPERVSAEVPAPTRRVGPVFIAAYAAAYFGTWMALLTPIIVALPLRIAQIDAKGEAGGLLPPLLTRRSLSPRPPRPFCLVRQRPS